jgi:hypothetical protein
MSDRDKMIDFIFITIITALGFLALFIGTGCGTPPPAITVPGTIVILTDASPRQCLTGGTIITTVQDNNLNGSADEDDPIVQQKIVCNGLSGITGQPGVTGIAGSSCTVTKVANKSTISCADGTSVSVLDGTDGLAGANGGTGAVGTKGDTGMEGAKGSTGAAGPKGDTGATGAAGSSITPVKLCSDSTSGYPEYGFILNGAVYGVYYGYLNSHGDPASSSSGTLQSFLAKLTPGRYQSTNGTGCEFSINSNGEVENQN